MITPHFSALVIASFALFAAAQTPAKDPVPKPSPFCCPKTQQSNDFTPKTINFVSASLKSDDPNILRCMYQGDQSTYCEYTLIPRDYVSFKYKAGELKTQGAARCSNPAVTAPSTPKEAANQGLACAPTLCCPPTQDSLDHPPQAKKLASATYRVEKERDPPLDDHDGSETKSIPDETVLVCEYESNVRCSYKLDGTVKKVNNSLCRSPAVVDVSSNNNCAKPL